jgi:hypothetical protein
MKTEGFEISIFFLSTDSIVLQELLQWFLNHWVQKKADLIIFIYGIKIQTLEYNNSGKKSCKMKNFYTTAVGC